MIGPEKPPLCAILCSESTPQKRRGSEGPFGIDSMKAAENCGDIQTLPTRQVRVDYKVYPDFFVFITIASIANQASCAALAFLGRDPQRPGVPPAHRAALRLRAYQKRSTCLADASFLGSAACKAAPPFGV